MTEDLKINLSTYKVILYKFKSKQLDFDIYDTVDFNGDMLTDPDLFERSVTEKEVEEEITNINKSINESFSSLNNSAESGGFLPKPANIEKNNVTTEYFYNSLKDANSYWLSTKDGEDKSIHWKQIPPLPADFKLRAIAHNEYLQLKKDIYKKLIPLSLYDLVNSNYVEEYDITDAVISIGTHQVSIDGLKNHISFVLDLSKLMEKGLNYIQENYIIDFYVDFVDQTDPNLIYGTYYGPSTKSELDLIRQVMENERTHILVHEKCHTRRFIGFINGIEYEFAPDNIPTCKIECGGLLNILDRCNIVKKKTIMTHFEHYPLDLKQPSYTIFQDNLNNLAVHEIFRYVLDGILDLTPVTENTYLNDDTILKLLLDDERLKEVKGLTFLTEFIDGKQDTAGRQIRGLNFYTRKNIIMPENSNDFYINFTSWSMLTLLYFKVKAKYKDQLLMIQNVNNYIPKEKYLFCDVAAIQEANEYTIRVYNLQVKTAHEQFFSEFSTGNEIFKSIQKYTFYDIFEESCGVLTCRPSRLNNFILDDTWFVIPRQSILDIKYSRNDLNLISRMDFSPVVPIKGQIMPFASNYVNSQVLVKYGLNIPGIIDTNPNLNKWSLATHFAAVALEWRNSINRHLTVTVYGDKEYCLGRVYFIEDIHNSQTGWLARLATVSTTYSLDQSGVTKTLEFNFARRVAINEIDESVYETD